MKDPAELRRLSAVCLGIAVNVTACRLVTRCLRSRLLRVQQRDIQVRTFLIFLEIIHVNSNDPLFDFD